MQVRDARSGAGITAATEGELSVAVQGGVSQTALVTISRNAPRDRRAVAIAVLSDLATLGHTSERAATQVQAALVRGPETLANLRAESAAPVQGNLGAGGAQVNLGVPRGNQRRSGTGFRAALGTFSRGRSLEGVPTLC